MTHIYDEAAAEIFRADIDFETDTFKVLLVDTDSTAMVPLHDPYAALVYAASPRDVRTTIIHGRLVMEDRRVLTVDAAAVRARMRTITDRINAVLAKGLPP